MNQKNQQNQQSQPTALRQQSKAEESLGKLDPKEVELLRLIRERFKFGEIIVQTRDGLPFKVVKATEYHVLD